jgi:hypothetical protein
MPYASLLSWHGTSRPRVADRGEGIQIWRVAANILNKQSRTADNVWSFVLEVSRGTKSHHSRETACYEMLHRASELVGSCDHSNEPLDSKQGGEILDYLSDQQDLNKESGSWR